MMYSSNNDLPFPWKLHIMLEQVELTGKASVVSWMPSGKAFKIHNHDVFSKEVLPYYFRSGTLKSFQRNLSIYQFKRERIGSESGSYRNDLFNRGNRNLCQFIKRKEVNARLSAQKVTKKAPQAPASALHYVPLQVVKVTPAAAKMQQETDTTSGIPNEIFERNTETILWMFDSGYSPTDLVDMLDIPKGRAQASSSTMKYELIALFRSNDEEEDDDDSLLLDKLWSQTMNPAPEPFWPSKVEEKETLEELDMPSIAPNAAGVVGNLADFYSEAMWEI
jgi:hypothetical protein